MPTTTLKARHYTADGKGGKEKALPTDPFDGVVNEDSIYATIKAYLANQRSGTASAKNRSAVRGGGRKPWRQKGTGRARHGSIRSPIWRGGGVIFPPTARSFREDVPRKVRRLARRSAFNARAAEGRILVVEELSFERPKTRQLVKLLQKLEVAENKVLLLTAGNRPIVYLSARNLPNVEVREFGTESAYDVLWADFVVIEEGAIREDGAAEPKEQSSGAKQKASDTAVGEAENDAAPDREEEEGDA